MNNGKSCSDDKNRRLPGDRLTDVISWAETEVEARKQYPAAYNSEKAVYLWMYAAAVLDLRDDVLEALRARKPAGDWGGAIDQMRNYPDGSYMRCPFCGAKSSTHTAECPIEIVAATMAYEREKNEKKLLKAMEFGAASASRSAERSTDDTAWLIEMPAGRWGTGYFWTGPQKFSSWGVIENAVRFSRRADAERVIEALQEEDHDANRKIEYEACEHEWPGTASVPGTDSPAPLSGVSHEQPLAPEVDRMIEALLGVKVGMVDQEEVRRRCGNAAAMLRRLAKSSATRRSE